MPHHELGVAHGSLPTAGLCLAGLASLSDELNKFLTFRLCLFIQEPAWLNMEYMKKYNIYHSDGSTSILSGL